MITIYFFGKLWQLICIQSKEAVQNKMNKKASIWKDRVSTLEIKIGMFKERKIHTFIF